MQKNPAIQGDGRSDRGTRGRQDAGEVCPTSEQIGKYLKQMRNIARRRSWGVGSGGEGSGTSCSSEAQESSLSPPGAMLAWRNSLFPGNDNT